MKKKLILVGFFLLSSGLALAQTKEASLDSNSQDKAETVQNCSAKTSNCDFGDSWELFKQNVSDATNTGAQVAKDAVNKASDYVQTGWEKTKSTTDDGWEKSKDLVAEGWQNTKEIARKGTQKVDAYFKQDGKNVPDNKELGKQENQVKTQKNNE